MSHPYDKRTVIIEGHTDNQPINPEAKLHNKQHIRAIEVWPPTDIYQEQELHRLWKN